MTTPGPPYRAAVPIDPCGPEPRRVPGRRGYESETPGENHPINAIRDLAAGLGRVRGVADAEQCALVRHVRT